MANEDRLREISDMYWGGTQEVEGRDIRWLLDAVGEARGQVAALRGVLTRLEWSGETSGGGGGACPVCCRLEGWEHESDCYLGAALSAQPQAEASSRDAAIWSALDAQHREGCECVFTNEGCPLHGAQPQAEREAEG